MSVGSPSRWAVTVRGAWGLHPGGSPLPVNRMTENILKTLPSLAIVVINLQVVNFKFIRCNLRNVAECEMSLHSITKSLQEG